MVDIRHLTMNLQAILDDERTRHVLNLFTHVDECDSWDDDRVRKSSHLQLSHRGKSHTQPAAVTCRCTSEA